MMILLCVTLCKCTTFTKNATQTSIQFYEEEHNFGVLNYQSPDSCTFEFTNTGKIPLIIYKITTSCGCTAATWNKNPIKPSNNGHIGIRYDAVLPGTFHKTITVFFNGANSPKTLKIVGKVKYPESTDSTK